MSTLTNAQKHIEELVAGLRGDDDFMPFLITNHDGAEGYFGLAAMAKDTKDDIADLMAAAMAVTRAQEAVFAAVSWVVIQDDATLNVMPSEHPDRKEAVFLVHVTRDGDTMHTARLHRIDRKVALGAWEEMDGAKMAGRFADALRAGMHLGTKMPDTFQQWCQERIDAGEIGDALRPAMSAFRKFRMGEMPDGDDSDA